MQYFDEPAGRVKIQTTSKNIQRYYTPKRLIRDLLSNDFFSQNSDLPRFWSSRGREEWGEYKYLLFVLVSRDICTLGSRVSILTRPTGSSKYCTTRKNIQRYYTPKRSSPRYFLKEIENMFSVLLSSYNNTRESLGELEKAVETLACGSWSHSISRSPKLSLVFL